MKKLVARTRFGRVFALAAAFIALAGAPAAAQIEWMIDCISWTEGVGCTRMQSCWYNTDNGRWGCTTTTAGVQ